MGWDERHSLVIERLSKSKRPRPGLWWWWWWCVCGCIPETIHVYNLLISAHSGNIILISLIMMTQSAEDKKTTTSNVFIQWWEESEGVTYVLFSHILSHSINRWLINTFAALSLGAAVLVKLKWDEAVTPPSRSLVQPSTCKRSRRNSKLVCMEGEGWDAVGDVLCCVQGQRRTGNPFHELWKGQTWRGENAAWPLLVNCTCGWESI